MVDVCLRKECLVFILQLRPKLHVPYKKSEVSNKQRPRNGGDKCSIILNMLMGVVFEF